MHYNGVFNGSMPSNLPGLYFAAEIRVQGRHKSVLSRDIAAQAAYGKVLDLIEPTAERFSVLRRVDAQNRVNGEVSRLHGIKFPNFAIDSASVSLGVDKETREEARDHEERERSAMLPQSESDIDVTMIKQFRRKVLCDPASAVAYLIMKDPKILLDKADAVDAIIKQVQTISDHRPNTEWVRTAMILQEFVHGLKPEMKPEIVGMMRELIHRFGSASDRENLKCQEVDSIK